MELEKLKVLGFKSFPSETEFKLESGITAIVGPNGCGKSNVVEAIRWALGEQNTHSLRAGSSEQLIFGGSETRQPLGMAEVSLTFANPNSSLSFLKDGKSKSLSFSEITVTRKLFRSGESEYFINKVPCRLKDIVDIFMDTGLGVNAYSIMTQAQVDMILNAKPEERREIFEEAAGITKYSKRKNEALRKLELTKQNLLRVQDIISELERQSNSLKRQVSKAKRYKKLDEELEKLKVLDSFYKYKKLQDRKGEIAEKISSAGKEEVKFAENFEKEEQLLKEMHAQLSKLEEEIEERREEQIQLSAGMERNNSVLTVNEERIKDLNKRIEEGKARRSKLKEELESVSEEIEEHSKKAGINIEEEKELKSAIEEYSGKVTEVLEKAKKIEKEIEEKNSRLIDYMSEKARLKNVLENSRISIHNLEVKLRKLADEGKENSSESIKLKEDIEVKKQKLSESRTSIEKSEKEIKSLEKSLSGLQSAVDEIERRTVSFRADMQMTESRLSALKEMQARDEGIQDSVKFIMDSESASDIQGLIFHVLEAPDKLQKAVDAALMDSVQGLIVKDESVASRLIDLLRNKERGRATFLPINNIKAGRHKRGLGYELIIDKIKFPKQFAGVFSYLLKNVVVAKNWKEAMKLYSSLPESFRIVTYNGELLHPGGLIHGGSKKGMHVLIGRKQRISKLEKQLNKLQEQINEAEQDKKLRIAEIEKLQKKLTDKRENLAGEKEKIFELEKNVASATEKIGELQKRAKFLTDEQRSLTEEEGLNEKSNKDYTEKLKEIEENIEKHNTVVKSIKEAHEALKGEEKNITTFLEDKKIKLNNLKQTSNVAREKLDVLEDKKQALLKEDADSDRELKESTERVNALQKELEESGENLTEQKQRIEVLKEDLKTAKDNRALLNEKLREKERVIRDKETEMGHKKDSLNSLKIEDARLETEIKDLKENVFSAHKVSLESFSPSEEEIDADTREKINELEEKLDRMGNVNLAAIEEEEELNERYNFYLDQQQDLLDSEQSLQETISKINSTARSLFRETINNVRKEFKKVFGTLFQGGEADIRLVGSKDVLESGVDIVISPPGKKLSSISLLSGGERALAAIALLFSLFKVKPSPFCILDEVDAALDEQNIERFTRFLRGLSDSTQFIIISHNKRTLSTSEVLYGVTMEEPGVSRLVSVKIKDKGAVNSETGELAAERVND